VSDTAIARLNEYDKTEWRDIFFALRPFADEQEFERLWTAFQREKARRCLQ
jgi:hypothetical protein